jgi:hypothetical protein
MRNRLRRLERKARGDGIVLRLKDGTARAFETMEVHKAMFLAQMDLFRKTSVDSEVLEAVRNATPESRAAFEERFGPITMSGHVIASEPEGGWVERYTLREDGRVEKTFYEGGAEEAERIRREAPRQGGAA